MRSGTRRRLVTGIGSALAGLSLAVAATLSATAHAGAAVCGDGEVEVGEQCDDGNTVSGDCCSALCLLESNGSPCDDGDPCTTGSTCSAGVCGGGTARTCPLCEACDGAGGCASAPRTTCRLPVLTDGASVVIRNRTDDERDHIVWKWRRGTATAMDDFGDPVVTDAYGLCIFDELSGTPSLLLASTVPAGGTCNSRPCWTAVGTGRFKYRNGKTDPDGITKILLNAGEDGRARIVVKGKGPLLGLPTLPLPLPARVQLQAENGQCWEATYSTAGVKKNDAEQFKGNGD